MSHELLIGLGIGGLAIGTGIVVLTMIPQQPPIQTQPQPANPFTQVENEFTQFMNAFGGSQAPAGTPQGTPSGGSSTASAGGGLSPAEIAQLASLA